MRAISKMSFFKNNIDKTFEKLLNNFFLKIKYGNLEVIFPSGQKKIYYGKEDGISSFIEIHNYKFLSYIIKKGSVGFAEGYMNGFYSTPNLTNLLMLAHKNEKNFLDSINSNFFYLKFSKIKHFLKNNSKSQSKKNIEYHYDLGNKFYEKWLDESMTYSSALFDHEYTSLIDGQINKYKKIAESLSLNENSRTLEIGCGWGGFSSYIAKNYNCKVDAITISKEQFNYTADKIQKEGLSENVSVHLKDYRDVNTKYSNIASIEMFEAVGKKYWEIFLETLKKSMTKNGSASLQIITINEEKKEYYQHNPDFIQQYIFPGGVLPSKKQLKDINLQLGLQINEIQNFSKSYAKTLNIWKNEFQNAWPQIASQGFKDRFKKMWEYYLSYCEVGFIAGTTDVSHFVITK